ncbi:MAG TPA: putative sugar nucleotidyl transferase [Pseudosphingobacterium sp.]|nr:putative sugar nucleotidyl transferase [Pseudosphingobacterium sp.]
MQIVLYDDNELRVNFYPLSLTRPVADLRVGILTIAEKWSKWLKLPVSYLTAEYLQTKYPLGLEEDVLLIKANICPDEALCEHVISLKHSEKLSDGKAFIAARSKITELQRLKESNFEDYKSVDYTRSITYINYPEDIFRINGYELRKDFDLLTEGRVSGTLSSTNTIIGDHIFVEEGASAECSTFNSLKGPIYLAKNSEIWEGCLIRGSFALGENSQVKMGAKIYSNVTVGPSSRVGGELNTCVIWGNSSKGHDGYFGSGVMGEWCNWGADTNNSNLKNNYKSVKLYHYGSKQYRNTGLQFCGLIMGDHSKCAINTAFNTGTVVGVGASIFGSTMPPTFIPDFSWGISENAEVYELNKMFETTELVFDRRNRKFDHVEKSILEEVFQITDKQRT